MPEAVRPPPSSYPDLLHASIADLSAGLAAGHFTSVDLTRAYLARIAEVNSTLRAVLETNPHALEQAAELDAERAEKGPRGPLHGIPILLKDNIATDPADGMQTTAGSFALLGALPPRPAHIVTLLTRAGALILGKASLSEWANFRGKVPSGWCARGGQCTNAYLCDGDPGGSSSGSGVAAAVGLAAACVGTETDGSILSPSRRNAVVGIKPTVGLTSRAGVIPISFTQDSAGPMTRCVYDAALLLRAMVGPDPRDAVTFQQPTPLSDYTACLTLSALRGARIGVPRVLLPPQEQLETPLKVFEGALDVLRELGATVVEDVTMPAANALGHGKRWGLLASEKRVLETEFRPGIEKYIADLPHVPTGVRTLEDLMAFNDTHAEQELIAPFYNSQSRWEASLPLQMDKDYHAAVEEGYRLCRTDGIDSALSKYTLDALVLPADANASTIAAVSGYPVITVPLGFLPTTTPMGSAMPTVDIGPGLPVGLAFIGGAWSEAALLGFAYAFEQRTRVRAEGRLRDEAMPKTQLKDVVGK
ncbi:amidase signature enzyme [Vararia minispora EC-137]|uniref:Amidase signature enzyme n=1 Tax=Vararia minispora EC-137 TaxID=1314806 RepID=A0ACB8QVB8_9AGAM|nr:amidase signature enzyme [Vararia minispora EC-137]